jgi:hypothetical protein
MHTRALHALLTVAEIAWSTKITTACVSCAERSRLRGAKFLPLPATAKPICMNW